jgi:hypothetical protein
MFAFLPCVKFVLHLQFSQVISSSSPAATDANAAVKPDFRSHKMQYNILLFTLPPEVLAETTTKGESAETDIRE